MRSPAWPLLRRVLRSAQPDHKARMSDLFEDPTPQGGNAHEFTVSEISGAVKRVIESEFGHIRVRGEVGRTMLARTGHLYFDLKDDRSVIACVSWKGQVSRLAHKPEEGMEVIVTGRMTTYGPQSKYQLNVEAVEPAGEGALMALLEKRKRLLQAEGLFAADRKKSIPYLPEVIGVVTSPSGAVIRDILHRLRDRFPRRVVIWPVAVQGRDCAPQVARAIQGFNAIQPGGPVPRPDLIIVARGGGSVEDLWGFNEEIVARAAAASDIPLISAVGHETDTTLIDFVSDLRAPTPTAAAELAVPVRMELLATLRDFDARLARGLTGNLDRRRQRLADLSRALPRPERLTETARQRLDVSAQRLPATLRRVVQARATELARHGSGIRPELLKARVRLARERLNERATRLTPDLLARPAQKGRAELAKLAPRLSQVFLRRTEGARDRLAGLDRTLQSISYRATLARGYAVVRTGDTVVSTAANARSAGALEIEFADGRVQVRSGAAPKKQKDEPDQGTLF